MMKRHNPDTTKNELQSSNLVNFRNRFGTFHDSVIHSVHYNIFKIRDRSVFITLGTRDQTIESDENWVNLTLEMRGMEKFVLRKPPNYSMSVIFHLNIGIFDGKIYMDFFPMDKDPNDASGYTESEKPGTTLIVVCERCFWSTSPYIENSDL